MEKREPTPEEHKRALIKDRCARIEKLLASVAKVGTPVIPYLQDVGAIKRKATQELSHIKLAALDDELATLFSESKSVPASDGEAIISPRRYELFFSSRGLDRELKTRALRLPAYFPLARFIRLFNPYGCGWIRHQDFPLAALCLGLGRPLGHDPNIGHSSGAAQVVGLSTMD